jgi:phage tail-like protein
MTAKRTDPFATFKFHVEIDGIKEAAFSDCSGMEMSTDVFEYQEGGLNEYAHKLPGRLKQSNITLKRGFATSNELFKWFSTVQEDLLKGKPITLKKVTITLYSSVGPDESMAWTLQDAFPVKWVGPAFRTDEAALAVESVEFAHNGITIG